MKYLILVILCLSILFGCRQKPEDLTPIFDKYCYRILIDDMGAFKRTLDYLRKCKNDSLAKEIEQDVLRIHGIQEAYSKKAYQVKDTLNLRLIRSSYFNTLQQYKINKREVEKYIQNSGTKTNTLSESIVIAQIDFIILEHDVRSNIFRRYKLDCPEKP
jgi:hypothetical protein